MKTIDFKYVAGIDVLKKAIHSIDEVISDIVVFHIVLIYWSPLKVRLKLYVTA